MREKGGSELWKSFTGAREETVTVAIVVVRALGPWCIQGTIHTPHDEKDVWPRRTLEADSLGTVMVTGQETEEVWLWVAAFR